MSVSVPSDLRIPPHPAQGMQQWNGGSQPVVANMTQHNRLVISIEGKLSWERG